MKQVTCCGVHLVCAENAADGGVFASRGGEYEWSGFGETNGVASVFVGVVACTRMVSSRFRGTWRDRTFGNQARGMDIVEAVLGDIVHVDELSCQTPRQLQPETCSPRDSLCSVTE